MFTPNRKELSPGESTRLAFDVIPMVQTLALQDSKRQRTHWSLHLSKLALSFGGA
jgi:hypothetical protein